MGIRQISEIGEGIAIEEEFKGRYSIVKKRKLSPTTGGGKRRFHREGTVAYGRNLERCLYNVVI